MRTLFQIIQQEFQKRKRPCACIHRSSSGSTPRGAGSRMLVGKKRPSCRNLGGGSVEHRAELMALIFL